MLIVVEGVDRTGKSSLCERQRVHTRSRYLHFSAPRSDDPWKEYVSPLEDYVPGSGEDVWVDRHYLGELVWPGFFGRDSIMSRGDQLEIERFLADRGALCVHAWRNPDELREACIRDGEEIGGRAVAAQRIYLAEVNRSSMPWWLYVHGDDFTWPLEFARELEESAARGCRKRAGARGKVAAWT